MVSEEDFIVTVSVSFPHADLKASAVSFIIGILPLFKINTLSAAAASIRAPS